MWHPSEDSRNSYVVDSGRLIRQACRQMVWRMTVEQLVELALSSGRSVEDVVLLWGERVGALSKRDNEHQSRGEIAQRAFDDVSMELLREIR